VKRFAILLLAIAACRSAPSYQSSEGQLAPSNGQLTGAVSPRQAVDMFLAAVRAQDLQAMSVVWGTSKGPARDVVDRSQLEKRELVMQCYLSHDKYDVVSDARTKSDVHVLGVSLSKGSITRETTFTTVRGPSDRWYVEQMQLEPLKDLCASR
jgi:hypothetical protein